MLPKNGYKGDPIKVGALRPEPVKSMPKDFSVLSVIPVSEERVLPPGVVERMHAIATSGTHEFMYINLVWPGGPDASFDTRLAYNPEK